MGKGPDGRTNGLGAVVFESVEEAEKAALELNKQYIGSRYVNLTKLDYKSYKIFNDGG